MKIQQSIPAGVKDEILARYKKLNHSFIHTLLQLVRAAAIIVILAVFFIFSLAGDWISVVVCLYFIAGGIKTVNFSNRQQGLRKTIPNLEMVHRRLGSPEYYDVEADEEKITVNGSVTILWKDVVLLVMYGDYFIPCTFRKTAAVLKVDSRQKQQICAIVNGHKGYTALLDKNRENTKLMEEARKKFLRKTAKELLLDFLMLAILLINFYFRYFRA